MKNQSIINRFALSVLIVFTFGLLQNCGTTDTPQVIPTVTADAGSDSTIDLGSDATLSGSGTESTGGQLFYLWEIISKPTSSFLFILNPTDKTQTLTPDAAGDYVFRLTVTNSTAISDSAEVTVSVNAGSAPTEIGGIISTDTNLPNIFADPMLPDYIASSEVSVQANLTIDADVKIVFADNIGLEVISSGSINAVGTASAPIVFTGVQAIEGYWMGINIQSNNTANELSFVTVEFAGSGGFDGANLKSNIMVEDAGRLKMTNSTSKMGAGYGLYTRNLESQLIDFANNTFSGNAAPVMTRLNHYQYFDAASDYSGNTKDYIDSYWSSEPTSINATWQAVNVPYRMANNIERIASDIIIMAGTELLGRPDGGFEIRPAGSLNAVGTSSSLVSFKGEQNIAGYWKGVSFQSNNVNNELTYVVIANGGEGGFDGANLKANIMVELSGRLKMTNSSSKMSGGYGLYTRDLESVLVDFANNTFNGNVAPIMTRINHYHYFDAASDFTGNTNDYIDSYWSFESTAINTTWLKLTVPYRMSNNLERIGSDIVIMPGAEFIGQSNGGLEVNASGTLSAIGTANEIITFRGEQNVTGYWLGLRFISNSATNELSFISIANGGEAGFDGGGRKANVEILGTGTLNINNSTITLSGGYGVRILFGGAYTDTNNTYSGNVLEDTFFDL